MNTHSKYCAFLVALASVCLTATCQTPHVLPVQIHFAGRLSGQPFACGKTYTGVGASGATVTPADLRFYVSDIQLLDASGKATPLALEQDQTWQSQNVALIDLEDGTGGCRNGNSALHADATGSAPHGTYTGLRFTLGVPFALDHQDSSTAPAPFNFTAMNWVWQSGYKFLRAEVLTRQMATAAGKGRPLSQSSKVLKVAAPVQRRPGHADTTRGGRSHGFAVHLGSTGCAAASITDPPTTECKHPNRVTVQLNDFDPARDEVVLDLSKLLADAHITQDAADTQPGCMSGEDDADCKPIFRALGLPDASGAPGEQVVFYREARP